MQANQGNQTYHTDYTDYTDYTDQSTSTGHNNKIKYSNPSKPSKPSNPSKPSKYGNSKSKAKYEPKAKIVGKPVLSIVKNEQTAVCSFGQQCHFFKKGICKSLHPCFFYGTGNCKFGDSCRSDHIVPIAKLSVVPTVNTHNSTLSPHATPFNPTNGQNASSGGDSRQEHKAITCQFNKSVCSLLNLCCPTHSGSDIIDVGHDGTFYIVDGLQFSTWDAAWKQVNKAK